jgi:hypothetical protein
MAPTSFTHGREKCPSVRRNNEPRIRTAKETQIIEQQKLQTKHSIFNYFGENEKDNSSRFRKYSVFGSLIWLIV